MSGTDYCSVSHNQSLSGIVPTVVDTAFASGLINNTIVGISFTPTTEADQSNGEITFGGVNPSRFDAPLTMVYGAFSVLVDDKLLIRFSLGTSPKFRLRAALLVSTRLSRSMERRFSRAPASWIPVLLCCCLQMVRPFCLTNGGPSLLDADAYEDYLNATGAEIDNATGFLTVTAQQYAKLPSIFFTIGGVSSFELA